MRLLLLLFLSVNIAFGYVDQLTGVNGKAFVTNKEKVFILFWATWCVECKDKMKSDLPEISKSFDGEVLTINIDENIKRLKHFIRKRKPKVTILRDEGGKLIKKLEVAAVPHWAYLKKVQGEWKIIDHALAFDRSKIDAVLKK